MILSKLSLVAIAAVAATALTARAQEATSVIEISRINPPAGAKTRSMTIETGGRTARAVVEQEAAITQADIKNVSAVTQAMKVTSGSKPETRDVAALRIQFTPAGQKKYAALVQEWHGKQIAVIVDGKLVATPVMNAKANSRELTVSGTFGTDESQLIAARANSSSTGLLPVAEGPIEKGPKGKASSEKAAPAKTKRR
jgi:preprotein translocase subunit SecD